jgi:hypothetical protein
VLSETTVQQLLVGLTSQGWVLFSPYHGYQMPELFSEALAPTPATGIQYSGAPAARPLFTDELLARRLDQILAAVDADKPLLNTAPVPAQQTAPVRGLLQAAPRPGPVIDQTLWQWGFSTQDDMNLACFLLDQALDMGLCRVVGDGRGRRLELDPARMNRWNERSFAERQAYLRERWGSAPPSAPTRGVWGELDIALTAKNDYALYQYSSWYSREGLDTHLQQLRVWMLRWILPLKPDTWYSFPRFTDLIRQLRPDLLQSQQAYTMWRWYDKQTPLEPARMSAEAWRDTYGRIIEAWLAGPATWLGYVQVAIQQDRVIAFQRPGAAPIAASSQEEQPAGLLEFLPPDRIQVRNMWKVGEMRHLVRRVAAEDTRSREATIYRLDPTAFRETLRSGQGAAEIAAAFSAAGFPLPPAFRGILDEWQGRAGRHQLYDNLAVIEFADDLALAEVQAMVGMNTALTYPISPRCLLVLDPDSVPRLIEDLRRKGYMPRIAA